MTEASQTTTSNILEKAPNQFTVYFNGRHYGYFTSEAGAEAFLACLKKDDNKPLQECLREEK